MKLIVFSGLPGTGKSRLAEAVGRVLGIPVFAKDWLEATLIRSELIACNQNKPLGSAGYQLLTTLAEPQLMLGQSAVLEALPVQSRFEIHGDGSQANIMQIVV